MQTKKEKRFESRLSDLLFNMSSSQNNNHAMDEEKIRYYRGILVSSIALVQAFYDCNFDFAIRKLYQNAPNDGRYIIHICLPESWRENWTRYFK